MYTTPEAPCGGIPHDGSSVPRFSKKAGSPEHRERMSLEAGIPEVVQRSNIDHGVVDEVAMAVSARANLLLVGDSVDVDSFLGAVRPELEEPLICRRCSDGLALPAESQPATLVLQDIGAMKDDDQNLLLGFLDAFLHRTQIVSTTSMSLLPYVQSGAFLDRLYYRLNVVRVEVGQRRAPMSAP